MKTPIHTDAEKKFCPIQEAQVQVHLEGCAVCRASFDSYNKNFGIAQTPPCERFLKGFGDHINTCPICTKANKNWNEDAIPVSDSMRLITGRMAKGIATIEEQKQLRDELMKKLGVNLF